MFNFIKNYFKKRFEEDSYSDRSVLTFHHGWEQGWFGKPPKYGAPPFSARRVRLAEKREKRALEEENRRRWEEKMRKKAERKKAREEREALERRNSLPTSS